MAQPAAAAPAVSRVPDLAKVERRVTVITTIREFGILIPLLLLVLIVSIRSPRFLSPSNLEQILLSVAIVAIVAVGQTAVILTRNVDLSVGSVVGLVAFVTGLLLKGHVLAVPLAIVVGLLLGLVLGAFNGLLVSVLRVPAIVATLGTLNIFRGLDFLISGGKQVSAIDLPQSYLSIATTSVFGVPVLIVYAVIIALIMTYVLRYTGTGRALYAIGSNPEAAGLVGLSTRRLVFGAFVVSGLLGAVAGVLWGSRFGTVNAFAGSGLELSVIAAVVVGGVNINGGSGRVLGAMIGAILLGTIDNALSILRISSFWLLAINGMVILIAIGTDAAIRNYVQRMLAAGGRRE